MFQPFCAVVISLPKLWTKINDAVKSPRSRLLDAIAYWKTARVTVLTFLILQVRFEERALV